VITVRNVLYATDFSPYANQAYFHAVALARSHGATLIIVHVYEAAPLPLAAAPMMPPPLPDDPAEQGRRRAELEQIRPLDASIPVRHVLLVGEPAAAIVRCAADTAADLIVIGTHGRTGLARLLMGSVAEKVLRGAACSVLVVKMPQAASAEARRPA
jgi:nucleotide-binding universal stress UspA family protein